MREKGAREPSDLTVLGLLSSGASAIEALMLEMRRLGTAWNEMTLSGKLRASGYGFSSFRFIDAYASTILPCAGCYPNTPQRRASRNGRPVQLDYSSFSVIRLHICCKLLRLLRSLLGGVHFTVPVVCVQDQVSLPLVQNRRRSHSGHYRSHAGAP